MAAVKGGFRGAPLRFTLRRSECLLARLDRGVWLSNIALSWSLLLASWKIGEAER